MWLFLVFILIILAFAGGFAVHPLLFLLLILAALVFFGPYHSGRRLP